MSEASRYGSMASAIADMMEQDQQNAASDPEMEEEGRYRKTDGDSGDTYEKQLDLASCKQCSKKIEKGEKLFYLSFYNTFKHKCKCFFNHP